MIILSLKVGDQMSINSNENNTEYVFDGEAIKKHLSHNVDVQFFDSIDSTNNEAKRTSHNLSDTPVLFVANHQHSGRGRLGRSFYSPHHTGIYMSLMLRQSKATDDIVCMTTAAAVCVCEAIKELCNLVPQIKWVNDIYVNNRKACGILCEAVTNPQTYAIEGIIIGIGINVSTADFPDELSDIATSLSDNTDRAKLCALVTDKLIDVCDNIADRCFIEKYKAYSLVINKKITYTQNGVTKTAIAIDIDQNGGLVIKTDNGVKTLSTGEITVRLDNND